MDLMTGEIVKKIDILLTDIGDMRKNIHILAEKNS